MALCLAGFLQGMAADWTVQVNDKDPPSALDGSIRATLQSKSVQVLKGSKPIYEFWFRTQTPLKSKPASMNEAMKALPEAALLGAVMVGTSERDYRDDELAGGLYTMRFALQPQDGNHLGTAEFPYFAVLTPAKLDAKLDEITSYKQLVKASSKPTSSEHPVILSLRPVGKDEGAYPRISSPATAHQCVRVKLDGKAGDASEALVLDLVVEGVAVH